MKKFSSKGFTVLELLIVIAIMCILIALILVGLNGARAHSHDENKMSTIQTIVVGLGQYHDICNVYPATLTGSPQASGETCTGLNGKYLSDLIPNLASYNFNGGSSDYWYTPLATGDQNNPDPNTCIAFHIGVKLETTDSNETSKSGFQVGTGTNPNQFSVCAGSDVAGGVDFPGADPLTFDLEK